MTFYESAEGETITRATALRWVATHYSDASEMLADLGDCHTYNAQAVLAWLGY